MSRSVSFAEPSQLLSVSKLGSYEPSWSKHRLSVAEEWLKLKVA
jgi:hypothetical protein